MTPTPPEAPDQGPEHNPDNLSPEQYGAPEWRLLRVGEGPRIGDEVYHGKDSWRTVTWKISGPLSNAVYDTYRRRVAPEPEQARNNALNKLAYEQSGEPRTECPTQGQRIAELERELWLTRRNAKTNDDVLAAVMETLRATIETLTRERDEARAEAKCCPNPLCGWIPQTYGEAVIGKWIKGDECINYEWDNRTTTENAKWLIELYRAQLAASEKDRQWQPIETAPKDGTVVFICNEAAYPCSVEAAASHLGKWWHGESVEYDYEPTHWMPLPKAPDAAMKEAK